MTAQTRTQNDNIALGVMSILFAVLALSLGDAVIKAISVSFPLWQIYVLRSVLAIPVIFALIKYRHSVARLFPVSLGWVVVRSVLLGFMWVTYYCALPHIELSVTAAAFYTTPLFITLFSGIFVGENVGGRGWTAIGIGFIGVIVMLRPHSDGFNLYALLPILAAILYALAMILTRTKCQSENPMVLTLVLNVTFLAMGIVASLSLNFTSIDPSIAAANTFLLGDWIGVGMIEFGALLLLATVILVGNIFTAIAYQSAPSSIVSTFDYSYLVFSIIWGVLFFAELPDAMTVVGMFLIILAGLITIRRKAI